MPNRRMKRLSLAVLVLLAACAPATAPPNAAGEKSVEAASPTADPTRGGLRKGTWLHAQSMKDGVPISWDFREDYTVAAPRPLPRLIVVSLGHEDNYDGSTSAATQAEQDAREKRLIESLKERAELVAVLDWRQQHDWFFYSAADVTREEVENFLGEKGFASLQVSLEDDPELQFYHTLKQRVHGEK